MLSDEKVIISEHLCAYKCEYKTREWRDGGERGEEREKREREREKRERESEREMGIGFKRIEGEKVHLWKRSIALGKVNQRWQDGGRGLGALALLCEQIAAQACDELDRAPDSQGRKEHSHNAAGRVGYARK